MVMTGRGIESSITRPTVAPCDTNLLVLSANRPESLDAMVENIRKYAEEHPESLSDFAYTLAMKRDIVRHRTCLLLTKTPEDTQNKTDQINFPVAKTASPSPVSLVFTGQGARWPQMGQELFTEYPISRAGSPLFLKKVQPQGSSWSIRGRHHLIAGHARRNMKYETVFI